MNLSACVAMRWRMFAAASLLLLYAVVLTLPAVAVGSATQVSGFTLLRRGWEAGEHGIYAWYANPLFVLACIGIAAGWLRTAAMLSILALLLALTSFNAGELARAGGLPVSGLRFRPGFYLWLAAMVLAAAYASGAAWVLSTRRFPSARESRQSEQ